MKKKKVEYYGKMDPECVHLCDVLNCMPGITTRESCCGHGERPYHIWFEATSLKHLPPILYWFMGCHCGFYGWRIIATTDCGMSPTYFVIEGPTGGQAYEQAEQIAVQLEEAYPHHIIRRP